MPLKVAMRKKVTFNRSNINFVQEYRSMHAKNEQHNANGTSSIYISVNLQIKRMALIVKLL